MPRPAPAALALLSALAANAASTAAVAGPSMSASWTAAAISLEACKERSQQAAKKAGFKTIRALQYSVFAESGDYSAMLRCATEKEAVFFAVAGPRVDRANRYIDDLAEAFKAGAGDAGQ